MDLDAVAVAVADANANVKAGRSRFIPSCIFLLFFYFSLCTAKATNVKCGF